MRCTEQAVAWKCFINGFPSFSNKHSNLCFCLSLTATARCSTNRVPWNFNFTELVAPQRYCAEGRNQYSDSAWDCDCSHFGICQTWLAKLYEQCLLHSFSNDQVISIPAAERSFVLPFSSCHSPRLETTEPSHRWGWKSESRRLWHSKSYVHKCLKPLEFHRHPTLPCARASSRIYELFRQCRYVVSRVHIWWDVYGSATLSWSFREQPIASNI